MGGSSRSIVAWILKMTNTWSKDIKDSLDARIKIQKIVFLMSRFIPELEEYKFNLYIYGPYSPDLANVYYELADHGDDAIVRLASKYHPSEDLKNILKKLSRLDNETLEVMATAYDIYKAHNGIKWMNLDEEFLIKRTRIVKPWASNRKIGKAISILRELGIISI